MRADDIVLARNELTQGAGAVRVRWLGTAGFEIEHDGWVLLIDPYLTRAPLRRVLASRIEPDMHAIRRHIASADAIVCGHTHFDHVLDVPAIARFTGAKVYGSRSAVQLCRAAALPADRLVDVQSATGRSETRAEVGPFELRFVPSAHSKFAFGRVPFPGDIADCDQVPTRAHQYRCGAVFGVLISVAGRTLYHAGSANLLDEMRPSLREVDVMLLCAAGWTSTPRFAERMLRSVSPRAILLSHWDNFFLSADKGARTLPAIKLPRLVDSLGAQSRDTKIGTLPLFGELML